MAEQAVPGPMRIGVIGGTGLYELLEGPSDSVTVETPYGALDVAIGPLLDHSIVFVNRHGTEHGKPPHRIDPRRTLDALARCQVDAVIGINNVGGLTPAHGPGHLIIPNDLVDLTGRDLTFHDDAVVHIDLSEPYCRHVRRALIDAAYGAVTTSDTVHDAGVYVGVRGPRLETPAEVRWLATLGDIVGMTGCPEATLARERGLCYGTLGFIANAAAGLGGRLSAARMRQAFLDRLPLLQETIREACVRIPQTRDCDCREAANAGRIDAPVPQV